MYHNLYIVYQDKRYDGGRPFHIQTELMTQVQDSAQRVETADKV